MIRFRGPVRERTTIDFEWKRRKLLRRAEDAARLRRRVAERPDDVLSAAEDVIWARYWLDEYVLQLQIGGFAMLRYRREWARREAAAISAIEPQYVGAVIYRDFAGRYSIEIAFVGERP